MSTRADYSYDVSSQSATQIPCSFVLVPELIENSMTTRADYSYDVSSQSATQIPCSDPRRANCLVVRVRACACACVFYAHRTRHEFTDLTVNTPRQSQPPPMLVDDATAMTRMLERADAKVNSACSTRPRADANPHRESPKSLDVENFFSKRYARQRLLCPCARLQHLRHSVATFRCMSAACLQVYVAPRTANVRTLTNGRVV